MGRHRMPYPPDFRAQLLESVKCGRTPEELARDFKPTVLTMVIARQVAPHRSGHRPGSGTVPAPGSP